MCRPLFLLLLLFRDVLRRIISLRILNMCYTRAIIITMDTMWNLPYTCVGFSSHVIHPAFLLSTRSPGLNSETSCHPRSVIALVNAVFVMAGAWTMLEKPLDAQSLGAI